MLKKYKNALLQAIERQNLDPADFELTEEGHRVQIRFGGTGLLFQVYVAPRSHSHFAIQHTGFIGVAENFPWTEFDNGSDIDLNLPPSIGFDVVLGRFEEWLRDNVLTYLEDQDTPDLWTRLAGSETAFRFSLNAAEELEPFSEEEKQAARQALNTFRLLIVENFDPTEDQQAQINVRLGYLAAGLERLNRFDWKGLALNTVISIGVTLSVDTAMGHQLWKLFEQAFQTVLKLLHG